MLKFTITLVAAVAIAVGARSVSDQPAGVLTAKVSVSVESPKHPWAAEIVVNEMLVAQTLLDVQDQLRQAQELKADMILFWINSNGGEVKVANDIFNLLQSSKTPVVCVGENALSAAFFMLQGCPRRWVLKNTKLLAHNSFKVLEGGRYTRGALQGALAELDEAQDLMVSGISERSGMSATALVAKLNLGDWVMTPAEALAANFVDAVFDTPVEMAAEMYRELLND